MAAFTVIDHQELTGTTASWSKTSIPSSYDHLLIVASMRQNGANIVTNGKLVLNSDTSALYSYTRLRARNATPDSSNGTSLTSDSGFYIGGASTTADTFGTNRIWIPHYSNTANYKSMLHQWSVENASTTNSEWYVGTTASLYKSTSAISAVQLAPWSGSFVQYSTFTLYGVTGA